MGIAEFPPVFPEQPKTDLHPSLVCLGTEVVALSKVQQSAGKSVPQRESQGSGHFTAEFCISFGKQKH